MATQMDTVIRHLRWVMLRQDRAGWTDGQLLASFIDHKDEAAFEALVRRHGPMVFGVCRRVVGNHHDAEDAFQATFLVLARKASSVRPRERVANWLHGVALRTAMKAKAMTAKRRGREKRVTEMPEPEAFQQDQWRDLQPLLDQELNGLPESYRLPILLCDLEGKTIKDAAQQLGWPQGSLAGRLARGRKLLAKRLANRGVALSVGSLSAVVSQNAVSAAVPTSLMSTTVKAAAVIAAGQAVVGVIPAQVAVLMEGVLKIMFLTKLKSVSVVLLVIAALSGTAGFIYQTQAAQQQKDQRATEKADKKKQSAVTKSENPKSDMERLQGTWKVVSMVKGGENDEESVGDEWTFKDCMVRAKDQPKKNNGAFTSYLRFRLDQTTNPKRFDFVDAKRDDWSDSAAFDKRLDDADLRMESIYAIAGDTLTICISLNNVINVGRPNNPFPKKVERPSGFKTGLDYFTIVLKRQGSHPGTGSAAVNERKPATKPKADEDNEAEVVAPNKEVAKSDKDQLLGKWLVMSAECNGQNRMQPWFKDNALLVIEEVDGKVVCKTVFKDKAKLPEAFRTVDEKCTQATLTLDARTKPKKIDARAVLPENGTNLGIYKLDGDTLTWCMSKALTPKVAETGKDRPTDFSTTSGDGRSLTVYKRQKEMEPKRRNSSPVPAKKADAGKTDLDRLQGVWSVVSIERGGKPSKLVELVFMVDGKRACLQGSDKEMQGGLYLEPTAKPKTFDLAMSTRTIEGIYSLEGDTLRLRYGLGTEAKRPSGFTTEKGSPQVLFVLKRSLGPEVLPFQFADGTRGFPTIIEPTLIEQKGTTPPPPPKVAPQPAAKVGKIIIVGNTKTDASVIRKMIPLHPGDLLNYDALRTAEKNLAAFSPTITVEESSAERGGYCPDCNVRVTVKEK